MNGRRCRSSCYAYSTCPSPLSIPQELFYSASVLAHYALISTHSDFDMPTPANLGEVFDHFVADTTLLQDGMMMETAGAQCLLLAGYFEDQLRRRHNIRWYADWAPASSPGRPVRSTTSAKSGS